MSHLEALIIEYLDWKGYLVRRNTKVGRLKHGGWEMELDVIAYHPHNGDIVHYEPSIDALSWGKREGRYKKKIEAAQKYIFAEVFSWVKADTAIRHIAVFPTHPQNRHQIAGAEIQSIDELMSEIRSSVCEWGPANRRAISESYLLAEAPAFKAFTSHGLQISFEIDLDPPSHTEGEVKTLAIAGNQVTVPTLNLPSLMAGKLHILLTRKDREKGRDWFDYAWYLRAGILPNVPQLQSAIAQTSDGPEARFWMSYLRERTQTVNWQNVRNDVKPFLEDPAAADRLNEVSISHLTPYPDFPALMTELHELELKHPILTAENPVWADIESAALEGIEEAIECRSLIADLEKKV